MPMCAPETCLSQVPLFTSGRKNRLQGVLHAGAVLDSGVIANIGVSAVRHEFAAKVHGAHGLIDRSGHTPLRALNLFSSLAAFSGSGGQGSYAAANAALDSWAQSLQARAPPMQAVALEPAVQVQGKPRCLAFCPPQNALKSAMLSFRRTHYYVVQSAYNARKHVRSAPSLLQAAI